MEYSKSALYQLANGLTENKEKRIIQLDFNWVKYVYNITNNNISVRIKGVNISFALNFGDSR